MLELPKCKFLFCTKRSVFSYIYYPVLNHDYRDGLRFMEYNIRVLFVRVDVCLRRLIAFYTLR